MLLLAVAHLGAERLLAQSSSGSLPPRHSRRRRVRTYVPQRGHGCRADEVHPDKPGLRRHLHHHRRGAARHTGYEANITRALLEVCRLACASCGTECEAHADMHEHCRICAEACRRCEQACADLLGSLG